MGKVATLIDRLKESPLFKDSFWALVGSTIGKGLSLIAGIAVARFLGSEIYGEYGVIRNTLTYIAIVSTFGFGYSATKFIAEHLKNDKFKIKALKK
ncbi:MAG: oligosaccharide flippase family protein [Alistipes sp.]|nr:oligosaccharide flippase family protein [Alistipes sp.]